MSIEKAAEAMWGCGLIDRDHHKWGDVPENRKNYWRTLARAALPHLLEEPTEGEITRAVVKFNESCIQLALNDFVRRRNAPPEPPQGEWENIKDLLIGLSSADLPETNRRVHEAYRRGAMLNQAAPPVPDPRREAILKVAMGWDPECAHEKTDEICSAIDSLKGTK